MLPPNADGNCILPSAETAATTSLVHTSSRRCGKYGRSEGSVPTNKGIVTRTCTRSRACQCDGATVIGVRAQTCDGGHWTISSCASGNVRLKLILFTSIVHIKFFSLTHCPLPLKPRYTITTHQISIGNIISGNISIDTYACGRHASSKLCSMQ